MIIAGERLSFRTALRVLILFVAALPAIIFPQYKIIETTGPNRVSRASFAVTDSGRIDPYSGGPRHLTMELWYPDVTEGQYPLIVFSHGSLGTRTSNESLYNELASHGYVVCAIDHTHQALYARGAGGKLVFPDRTYTRELSTENARLDRVQSHQFYQGWMKIRTGDINFTIDHVLAEASKSVEPPFSLVDASRIGVIGHSLGGSAALGLGRFRDDISAVVALEAPFMCDIVGVEDGEFVFLPEEYPVPVLNIYSDDGWVLLGQRPQYARNYALLTEGQEHSFNIHLPGTGHFSLTDLALASPFITRQLNQHKTKADARDVLLKINQLCLQLFDCYLKGEGTFRVPGGQ